MWAGDEFIFIIYILFAWAYMNLYGATSGVFFFFLKVLILIKSLLKCKVIAATNLLCCRLKLSETDTYPTDFIAVFSW